MTRRLGIGVVGFGWMGQSHSRGCRRAPAHFPQREYQPDMVVVSDVLESRRTAAVNDFGFREAVTDWHEVVSHPDVDVVFVTAPNMLHVEIVEAAAANGKHVFCEKPLGLGTAESGEMLAAAERSRCVHMTGFNYIRTPASQLARQIIANGEIGRVTWFRGEHTEDFCADPAEPASWRTRGRANGNMGDLSPHIINAALALMGPIGSLCAEIETVHRTRPVPGGSARHGHATERNL